MILTCGPKFTLILRRWPAALEVKRVMRAGWRINVHLAIRLPRTVTIADLVQELKTSASKWVKTQSPELAAFSWPRSDACFSVEPSDLEALREFIDHQEEHHRTRTFQEGFRALVRKYNVDYDEAFVWD